MALASVFAGGCHVSNPAFVARGSTDGRLDLVAPVDASVPADAAPTADVSMPADATPADTTPADTTPADATPDRSPEAAPDLPAIASPIDRTVAIFGGGSSASFGGTGGDRFEDACGIGEALIGYRGKQHINTSSSYIVTLEGVCGRLRVPAGTTAVDSMQSTVLPLRGLDRDSPWQVMCPDDQVMIGFSGLLDDDDGTIQQFQFRCAPLNVVTAPPGAIAIGNLTTLPWTGTAQGTEVTTSCPAGQIGRGHVTRVGSFIDAYQMTCGTPSVTP